MLVLSEAVLVLVIGNPGAFDTRVQEKEWFSRAISMTNQKNICEHEHEYEHEHEHEHE